MSCFQKEAKKEPTEAHKEVVKDWILRYAEQSSESSGEDPEEDEDPVSCGKANDGSAACFGSV